MKEFWYAELDRYLVKADAHDNPKTLKMYEINTHQNSINILAVTYLRTCLIGIQKKMVVGEVTAKFIQTLEEHDHDRGVILEVGKLT